MAIESYFFNAVESDGVYDRVYNSEDFCNYLDLLVGNGVFPNPSTNLQVRSANDGMKIVVGAGSGWINGHKMINTADLALIVPASDVVLNRVDRVIFFVDYVQRTMGIEIKEGTPAADARAKPLQQDSSRFELSLATIIVKKQTSAITDSLISDTRGSNLCPWVSGLIDQIDASTLFQQFQDAFNTWFTDAKEQFQAGKQFKKLEGIHVTTQPNESSFNVLTYVPHYSFAYDILEVYINGIHLTGNDYTLSNSYVNLEIPIEEVGAVVDFVVYKSVDND